MASVDQEFEYKGAKIHWIEFSQGDLDLVIDPERRQKLTDVANDHPHSVVMNGSFFFVKDDTHQPTYYLEREGIPLSMSRSRHGALGWSHSHRVWDVIAPRGKKNIKYRPRNTSESTWKNMSHVLMGAPLLINKGKIMSVVNKPGSFYQLPFARSVVAQKDNGNLVFIVVETGLVGQIWMKLFGQWPSAISGQGLSLTDLAIWLKSRGVDYALNLDGGGSVGLAVDGRVLVKPRFKWQRFEYERGLSHFLVVSNYRQ
jgi:hypothetical protein